MVLVPAVADEVAVALNAEEEVMADMALKTL